MDTKPGTVAARIVKAAEVEDCNFGIRLGLDRQSEGVVEPWFVAQVDIQEIAEDADPIAPALDVEHEASVRIVEQIREIHLTAEDFLVVDRYIDGDAGRPDIRCDRPVPVVSDRGRRHRQEGDRDQGGAN